jgi:lipoprotein-anchoring transpeptidase ErfK/SrfK
MTKSLASTLSQAGLLLAAILAITPTSLHAEPKPLQIPASGLSTTPQAQINRPAIVTPIKATGAQNPVAGMSISTPNRPVTNSSIPTVQQPAKPTTATAIPQTPIAATVNLILKLKERKVYVYDGGKVIAKYPVAIGKKGWETPTGEWQVMEKITNPAWTSFKNGSVIKPGTKNPLGERWIGFWTDGKDVIGFHGTPDVKSVGKAVSHGCVRMFDKDVKALFPLVKVGTTVKVVNE